MKRIFILLFIAIIGTSSIAFGQSSKNSTTAPKASKSSKGSKSSSSSSKSSSGSSSKSNSSKVNKSFANAHRNKNINSTSIFPSQGSSQSSNSLFPKASSNTNNSASFSSSGSSGTSKLSSLMGSKNMFSDLKESKSTWNWQATESEKPQNYIRYRRPPINSPYYQSKASFTYSGNIRTEKSKGQISQKLKLAKHFSDKAAVKPNRQYDPATYYMGQ